MDLHDFWFGTVGILMAGYAILDGFDLGVGSLHFVARTDDERRLFLNAIGPVWDGNEVWLVTFGGALFAAFPVAYGTAFSGFYLPFMLVLFALIFRAVAIEFRSKQPMAWWRQTWDVLFFLASASSALLFGSVIGTVMQGVPIGSDSEYAGHLGDLLTPYALLVGVFTLAMFALHGAVYLYLKTTGELQQRIKRVIWTACGVFVSLYMFTTIATLTHIPNATRNFGRFPLAWGIVALSVLAIANIPRSIYKDSPTQAFISSATMIGSLVSLVGVALYPDLLTSNPLPQNSLTIFNAASSLKTLGIMQWVALIGMPFVLGYTAIIYWVFRGKAEVTKHGY
jgi:cytochrome d ubiquinol oxidase subunit II